ncbi:MAG: C-GCAxxG-C-C family protein [Planctomycetota bacterium]
MTDTRVEAATAAFDAGHNCSQAVLSAFAPQFGLDGQTAMRLAAPLGGGIGCTGNDCGAVTGAVLVLGLRYGEATEHAPAYQAAREFLRRFRGRFGATDCRELLECDISTPSGMARAQAEGLLSARCPQFVEAAAELLVEMLEDES